LFLYNCLPGPPLHLSSPKLLLVSLTLTSQSWGVALTNRGLPSAEVDKLNVLTTMLRHTGGRFLCTLMSTGTILRRTVRTSLFSIFVGKERTRVTLDLFHTTVSCLPGDANVSFQSSDSSFAASQTAGKSCFCIRSIRVMKASQDSTMYSSLGCSSPPPPLA
jgi:hypothetical protein